MTATPRLCTNRFDLIYPYTNAGVAHADLLSCYMKRRKTLWGIQIFFLLLVHLLPMVVGVFCCTKIVVQLSCWLGKKAPVGRGSLWPAGTGPGSPFLSPTW
jgi:hypothetical protein